MCPAITPCTNRVCDAEDLDRAAAASIFAQNPQLVSLIQGRLGGLIGRSSGYIESLPTEVKRRVSGLKGIQRDHSKLEAEFQEEVLQLEKKYFAKFTPLYEKRSAIVNGKAEPTEDEIKAGEEDEIKDEDDEAAKEPETTEDAKKVAGIPEFWLSAMKNQVSLAEMITDRDEEALKSLIDIRMEYLDKPGFRLIFEFAENAFFTNKIVTKTYFYQNESGYGGDFIYDHAEGEKIEWKEGQDLTVRIEQKKQRNKSKSSARPPECFLLLTLPQTPSRPASSRRPFPQSLSSTSSPRPRPRSRTMTTLLPTSRSVSSSTTSSARTSRRSSFPAPSIGSPARPSLSRSSMRMTSRILMRTTTRTMTRTMTRMMRMRRSLTRMM